MALLGGLTAGARRAHNRGVEQAKKGNGFAPVALTLAGFHLPGQSGRRGVSFSSGGARWQARTRSDGRGE